jgi:excisionase family DNA binding protein
MDPFQLYTIEETTQILKVTQRTVYNFISNGQLKAVKIGKYWRIKHTDLQDFIDRGSSNQAMTFARK